MERPLPDWPRETEQGATIIVSVPTGAQQVELTVEDNGRPQTTCLIEGVKRPGFPLAFYRPHAETDFGFSHSIDMPVGKPVIVSGRLTTVDWSPYTNRFEWLPEGQSYLMLTFDEFSVDRPCCDLANHLHRHRRQR